MTAEIINLTEYRKKKQRQEAFKCLEQRLSIEISPFWNKKLEEIPNLSEKREKFPIEISSNLITNRDFTRQKFKPITDKIIPNLIKQYRAELDKEAFPLSGIGIYCLLLFDYEFCDEELVENHINLSFHKINAEELITNNGTGMAEFIQMCFCNVRARTENIKNVHFKFYSSMKEFFDAPSHFRLAQ